MPKETLRQVPGLRPPRPARSTVVPHPPAPKSVDVQRAATQPLTTTPQQIAQLQSRYGNRAVQRLIQRAQVEGQSSAPMASPIGLQGGEVGADLQRQINSALGGGRALDRSTGAHIGDALGADFSRVRVHTDAKADSLNRSLSAKAFTLGKDVFFRKGAYSPDTSSGQHLLAHELTHVAQQDGVKPNKVQTKLTVGAAGDRAEQVAEQNAQRVTQNWGRLPAPVKDQSVGSAPNAIQRYTVINPEDYSHNVIDLNKKKDVLDDKEDFPEINIEENKEDDLPESEKLFLKQRLNHRIFTERNKRVYQAKYETGYFEKTPPLRVSEKGQLAIEHTDDQPKVFYAKSDLVSTSNERLEDIGSAIKLKTVSAKSLNVPQDPKNVKGSTHSLVMVEPVNAKQENGKLMSTSECKVVAQNIINGQQIQLGDDLEGETIDDFKSDEVGTGTRLGDTLAQMDPKDSDSKFAKTYQNYKDAPIDKLVAEKFSDINKVVKISDTVLRELSRPGVTPKVIKQVHQLYEEVGQKKTDEPEASMVVNWIRMRRTIPMNQQADEKLSHSPGITKRLGINEHARPEVGQAFSMTGMGASIPIVDEDNIFLRSFNLSDTTLNEQDQALEGVKGFGLTKYLEDVERSGFQLNGLRANLFSKIKTGITFGEHHGAVVAKDGVDTVTFENFNRPVETDTVLPGLWDRLANDFKSFASSIEEDIREAKDNKEVNVRQKMVKIRKAKIREMDKLKNDLVTLYEKSTFAQVNSNLGIDNDNLWHFRMYGGQTGQSFHEVWSKAVVNPATVRTTAPVSKEKVEEFKQKIKQAVKEKSFKLNDNHQTKKLNKIYKEAKTDLYQQKTLVGASQVYREALNKIQKF